VYIKKTKTEREVVNYSNGQRYAYTHNPQEDQECTAALITIQLTLRNNICNITLQYDCTRRRRPRATIRIRPGPSGLSLLCWVPSSFLSAWWRSRHHHSVASIHRNIIKVSVTLHTHHVSSYHIQYTRHTSILYSECATPPRHTVYTLIYFQIHSYTWQNKLEWNPGGGGRGSTVMSTRGGRVHHHLRSPPCKDDAAPLPGVRISAFTTGDTDSRKLAGSHIIYAIAARKKYSSSYPVLPT
jgi:hypothetical protein